MLQGGSQGSVPCLGEVAWVWWGQGREGSGQMAVPRRDGAQGNLQHVLPCNAPERPGRGGQDVPGATTTTKDGFGGRRVGSNPGQRSGAFSSCSTTPSAQGAQRLHADGALAFCPLPITSLQSQLDLLREKDLPSERTDLRKIAAKRKSGENSSQGSGLCWSG